MSNLNGGNVRSLMEAYNSIYEQPQEEMLTEEQIIVNEFCESWFQQCIDEDVDFSQYSDDVILEAMCEAFGQEMGTPTKPSVFAGIGSWFNKNVQAWKDRGVSGKLGLNQKPTQPAANPAATSRPAPAAAAPPKDVIVKAAKGGVPGTLNKTTGKWTASAPAAAAPTKPSAPLADKVTPATKLTTSYAGATGVKPVGTPIQGGVKPVAGAPTQASLSTAKPEEKANILGNKASELAALQAKAKADTMARRQTTQRPMGPRGM